MPLRKRNWNHFWKNRWLVPLAKPGLPQTPQKLRTICLVEVLRKLWMSITINLQFKMTNQSDCSTKHLQTNELIKRKKPPNEAHTWWTKDWSTEINLVEVLRKLWISITINLQFKMTNQTDCSTNHLQMNELITNERYHQMKHIHDEPMIEAQRLI